MVELNAKKIHGGITEGLKEMVYDKLKSLETKINKHEPLKVTLSKNKNLYTVKASCVLDTNKHIRVAVTGNVFEQVLDELSKDLHQLIDKHYKKLETKKKDKVGIGMSFDEEEEDVPQITKRKFFSFEEMTEDEAMERIEDLGHDTFIFKNKDKNGEISMLYIRQDGYGLIQFE